MSDAAILEALNRNDIDAARDLLLQDLKEEALGKMSWDSPQYRTDANIQRMIVTDDSRDSLFTYFGLRTLMDRYMLRGPTRKIVETPQGFWARVATGIALAGFRDEGLGSAFYTQKGKRIKKDSVVRYAQKLYDLISRMWFTPATPVLTNIGTNRGLPISCFLNAVDDSMEGITGTNTENAFISKGGGGLGTFWGNVRHRGAKLKSGGESSGIIPFLKIMDSQILAVSQGNTRRGAGAVYLPVWHPEIEEFVEIRKPTGGDTNRRCLNLNHGIVVDDEFMQAACDCAEYALLDPRNGDVVKKVDAQDLLRRIIALRMETGEPYLLFIDTVNKATPIHHQVKNLWVQQSNLCSEITLPTGPDRTAVCCLGSMNLERYDQWKDDQEAVYLAVRALDNVLQAFCNEADDHYAKAVRSAESERSVGLGVMGYHGYLMQKAIPFESLQARLANRSIFKRLHEQAIAASERLAAERGVCPDGEGTEFKQRNSYVMSIAPTASISIIAGNSTPCIEPVTGNAYVQKTMGGTFLVKNRYLSPVLAAYGKDTPEVWQSIIGQDGSVQHLDFLNDHERAVFRTAWEMNQRELVTQAGDRQPYICQAQSLNLFFDVAPTAEDPAPGVSMRYLFDAHVLAWKAGVKSLYYLRTRTVLKADSTARAAIRRRIETEECAVCQ